MASVDLEEEELDLVALIIIANEAGEEERKQQRKATLPYVLARNQFGAFHCLVHDLAEQDPQYLHKFLRMNGDTFDELLHRVGPIIQKQNTNYKESIAPEERLAVTLRFLAEGCSYDSLFFLFRIPKPTLVYIIRDTCGAMYSVLKDQHLKMPETKEQWRESQTKFFKKWHFPQCLGAMDGKHIRIQCPPNGGSAYFNYCGFHSIVLFALVDADHRFLYYEVGAPGRDATIWNGSQLKTDLEGERLHAWKSKALISFIPMLTLFLLLQC